RIGHRLRPRALPEAAELALRQAAIDDNVVREAGHDRGCRVADRTGSTATAAPEHVGETDVRQPQRRGQAGRVVAVVAVGGEAVALGNWEAGGSCGLEVRSGREPDPAHRRGAPPVVRRLADAGDRDLVLDGEFVHRGPSPQHCRTYTIAAVAWSPRADGGQ